METYFNIPGNIIDTVFDFGEDYLTIKSEALVVVRLLVEKELKIQRTHFKSKPYVQKLKGCVTMGLLCQHKVNFMVFIPLAGLRTGTAVRAVLKPTKEESCAVCCEFCIFLIFFFIH